MVAVIVYPPAALRDGARVKKRSVLPVRQDEPLPYTPRTN
jgi:hypothetical protein